MLPERALQAATDSGRAVQYVSKDSATLRPANVKTSPERLPSSVQTSPYLQPKGHYRSAGWGRLSGEYVSRDKGGNG